MLRWQEALWLIDLLVVSEDLVPAGLLQTHDMPLLRASECSLGRKEEVQFPLKERLGR